jgi:hypothetical protein
MADKTEIAYLYQQEVTTSQSGNVIWREKILGQNGLFFSELNIHSY